MQQATAQTGLNNVTATWVRSDQEFSGLRAEWNELLDDTPGNKLFVSWEWMHTWWNHLGGCRDLSIITVRRENQLIAIAPFTLRPRQYSKLLPFRALEFLGSGNVGSDYLSILVRNNCAPDALPAIADLLLAQKLALELSNIDRTSVQMLDLALKLTEQNWRADRVTTSFSPNIRLGGHTWDSYRSSVGALARYNKKLRKLKNDFRVEMRQAVTDAEREEGMNILLSLHEKRWRGRGGSNAFHTPELIEFHKNMSAIALQQGWLRLFVLMLDDEPAAAVYGFSYNKVFYYYQAGFEPKFSRYSVGMLATSMTIQHAMLTGDTEYDFLHGEEEYKYFWANDERELVRLNIYPAHIPGYVSAQAMMMRRGVKKILWPRVSAYLKSRVPTAD